LLSKRQIGPAISPSPIHLSPARHFQLRLCGHAKSALTPAALARRRPYIYDIYAALKRNIADIYVFSPAKET
jgi:hypothetical protein